MDYSGFFTVEIYGSKGWEVKSHFTSLKDALDFVSSVFPGDYQLRVTTPVIKKNWELIRNLEDIQQEHSQGLTTPEEFAERVTLSVLESL